MSGQLTEAKTIKYDLEIAIDAPRDRVWEALTNETNGWWLPDFRVMGEGSVVRMDARAGGHVIEEGQDGASLLWYTVQMCKVGESLHLVGHVAPAWGGPATTLLQLSLVEQGAGTLLRVEDALYGNVSESSAASLKDGWGQLFTDGLKAHAEKGS